MGWSGRLYRDRENGLFLGVCAGLAECFNVRVSVLRVLAVMPGADVLARAFCVPDRGLLLHDRPLVSRRDHEQRFWRSGSVESERWS